MRAFLGASVVLWAGAVLAMGGVPARTAPATMTAPAGPRVVETRIGRISLPEKWSIEELQGIDSLPGKIVQEGGVQIDYDMEKMAGEWIGKPRENSWYREQVVAGQSVKLSLLPEAPAKPGGAMELVVAFVGHAGGLKAKVTKLSDVAEMLAVVLTLETKGEKTAAAKNVLDLSGKLSLPEGWEQRALQGVDSMVGELVRKNDLTVRYDIGAGAGVQADPARNKFPWHMEQVVRGHAVKMALEKMEGQDRLIISIVDGYANFSATVKSLEDVADVMTLVMSYDCPVVEKAAKAGAREPSGAGGSQGGATVVPLPTP